MIVTNVDKRYKDYMNQENSRWFFGNSILYRMCEENPYHDDKDVIVGKIWLIGRSYAAAIERRKTADGFQGDDFYYDVVAPKLLEIGEELDSRISVLKHRCNSIEESVALALSTHKLLMDAFWDITHLEKRSLASKYLHFHCPDKFFIFDSRAREAIGKIVRRPDKAILSEDQDYDDEYADFVCRMIELQNYLAKLLGTMESPRNMDSFLLNSL